MEINIKKLDHLFKVPEYATTGSACLDIYSANMEDIVLKPGDRYLIPTGFVLDLPSGYECQIRPRSGLSINNGVTLINCIGTIDSDYKQEVKIPLINLGEKSFVINRGMRVAQMLVSQTIKLSINSVTETTEECGRTGGFGSTGL